MLLWCLPGDNLPQSLHSTSLFLVGFNCLLTQPRIITWEENLSEGITYITDLGYGGMMGK